MTSDAIKIINEVRGELAEAEGAEHLADQLETALKLIPDNKTRQPMSILEKLEELQIRLESLEGLTRVCSAAFTKDSFDRVNPKEIQQSYDAIHDSVHEVTAQIQEMIIAITDHIAKLNY